MSEGFGFDWDDDVDDGNFSGMIQGMDELNKKGADEMREKLNKIDSELYSEIKENEENNMKEEDQNPYARYYQRDPYQEPPKFDIWKKSFTFLRVVGSNGTKEDR